MAVTTTSRSKAKGIPKPKAKKSAIKRAIKATKSVKKTKEKETEDEGASDDAEDPDEGERDFSALAKQVKSEYTQGWWFIKPKWDEWALRYKLYNNQKRDKDSVGDNTLFTIMQTVLAGLYEDDLTVSFVPRESGDEETAENLTQVAVYDHAGMEKDIMDYEWDFETLFHGRGLVCLMDFDRDEMLPVPEVWHAMTVIRDPYATSVNGDKRRRGAARFLYRERRLSKDEMKEAGVYFNFENLKPDQTSTNSLVDENMRIVAEAAGLSDVSKFSSLEGENATVRVVEGFTVYKGKRVFVTLADDMKRVIRFVEFENTLNIPIIDRVMYPVPNSWDSVSIPDLVEDKQRARAVLTNLGLKSAKSSIHPMYLFDQTRVKNKGDLNFEFNKFIPVNGNTIGAVTPMNKDRIAADVQYILDTLAQGAERSAATPDVKQGARPNESGTATRDALVSQGSDTRYSLAAKIWGWSEKRFWRQWYALYKEHFVDGIDEKSIRITGALGAKWRPFTRENLITPKLDPDVSVESRVLAEQRKFNELQQFRGYVQMLIADPTANLRYALRHMGRLMNLKKDVIDQLLPPTVDEIQAEEENIALRDNERVDVLPEDDHYTHIEIHNKMEDTPAKMAHINAHKRAMLLQKLKPELFPPTQANRGVNAEQVTDRPLPQPTSSRRALPA